MKKSLLIIALIVIVAGSLNIFFGPEPLTKQEAAKQLPWKTEITAEGNTRVLDIEIGASTLEQIKTQWKVAPQIALFRAPDGTFRLESFLGKVKVGPFQARIIFNLEASDEQLAEFAANSTDIEATPSGSHQLRLSKDDFERAMQLPIDEMSYSPAVDTEKEMLSHLFGDADGKVELGQGSSYWLYPQRGLVLLVNDDDKEVFHYFPQRNYEQILRDIERIKQARAELPAAPVAE